MKLSSKLFDRAKDLWEEATQQTFVREMAVGTLAEDRFKTYIIQDYYYLEEYIGILQLLQEQATEPSLRYFLGETAEVTKREMETVHLPNMRKLGISEKESEEIQEIQEIEEIQEIKEIKESKEIGAIKGRKEGGGIGLVPEMAAYLEYMKSQAKEGLLPSLTALLQCSWAYAYIAARMLERYPQQIDHSPYKDWFMAYTSPEYVQSNEKWMAVLDSETENITEEYAETLCDVFETCAAFENRFWESFYG